MSRLDAPTMVLEVPFEMTQFFYFDTRKEICSSHLSFKRLPASILICIKNGANGAMVMGHNMKSMVRVSTFTHAPIPKALVTLFLQPNGLSLE